jgi:hypothetical protein
MKPLFPLFVTSAAEFARAKIFWAELFAEVATHNHQASEWAPWTHEESWSPDPEFTDGAVMLSRYSQSQNKGVRVQQNSAGYADDDLGLESWMDVFGEDLLPRPVPNLFLGGVPTAENVGVFKALLSTWMDRSIQMPAMVTHIDECRKHRPR